MLKGGGNIVIHIFEIVMDKFKIDFSSKQTKYTDRNEVELFDNVINNNQFFRNTIAFFEKYPPFSGR